MSAFLSFLGHLTVLDWLFILIAWVIIAFALGTFAGLGIKCADRHDREWTDLALAQPPVPTQADVDSVWLDVWPSAVDEDALMHAEFVSLISTTWHWPEDADA